jgi:hypothetical protein
MAEITRILSQYMRLPGSTDTIPGGLLESVIAHVRGGIVLKTYDFIDVVKIEERCGWQIKSTKAKTPVTWKRAKIPDSARLIKESKTSSAGLRALGTAIITFCNDHAAASIRDYGLDEIGFCRLIVHDDGTVTYYERMLCTRDDPVLFNVDDFEWHWSTPKRTVKKEQLPALHGIHLASGRKWFAWHGLGENQLHFSGEGKWWPSDADEHHVTFRFPNVEQRVRYDQLTELLTRL